MTQKTQHPLVQVTWIDITSVTRWESLQHHQQQEPLDCVSVGYVIRSDKKQMTIAQTLCLSNGDVTESLVIPRSVIRNIKVLK